MARSKQYVREQVIQKASGLFLAKGYQSTSLAELMQVTGLNKKSLYNEFGNKEALFLAVLDDYIAREAECVTPLLSCQPLGVDNIRAFFEHLFERFATTGCLLTLSVNEQACLSDNIMQRVNQTLLAIEAAFVRNLADLPGCNESQVAMHARNLLALMQGFTSLTRSPQLRELNLPSLRFYLDSLQG